jgi:hypothetical protein
VQPFYPGPPTQSYGGFEEEEKKYNKRAWSQYMDVGGEKMLSRLDEGTDSMQYPIPKRAAMRVRDNLRILIKRMDEEEETEEGSDQQDQIELHEQGESDAREAQTSEKDDMSKRDDMSMRNPMKKRVEMSKREQMENRVPMSKRKRN